MLHDLGLTEMYIFVYRNWNSAWLMIFFTVAAIVTTTIGSHCDHFWCPNVYSTKYIKTKYIKRKREILKFQIAENKAPCSNPPSPRKNPGDAHYALFRRFHFSTNRQKNVIFDAISKKKRLFWCGGNYYSIPSPA